MVLVDCVHAALYRGQRVSRHNCHTAFPQEMRPVADTSADLEHWCQSSHRSQGPLIWRSKSIQMARPCSGTVTEYLHRSTHDRQAKVC